MSKPYINVTSLSYASPTLSVAYQYSKLRGISSFTIDGFSSSVSVTPEGYSSLNESQDITVGDLGTSSYGGYTPSTLTFAFTGAPATNSNLKVLFGGSQILNVTASNTTLSTFMSEIADANTDGRVTVTSTTVSVSFAANFGNYYNGTTMSYTLTKGSGTIIGNPTVSGATTFAGGITTYNLTVNNTRGGYIDLESKSSDDSSTIS